MFAVLSQAREEFFISFFAIFFVTLSLSLPRFLKKSLNPPATIVLSLTVTDFILLQIEQLPISTLLSSEVISPLTIFVADLRLHPTQKNHFYIFESSFTCSNFDQL